MANLEHHNKPLWLAIGFALIACLGFLDYMAGYEFSFSLFYLAPITLIAWFTGRRLGFVASATSAVVWLLADMAAGHPYSHYAIHYWNSAIRLGFFVIVTLLLSALREALEREQGMARTDYLTGLLNARYFHDRLRQEIDRSHRFNHPFTLAYLDLDDFKSVNDLFGHDTGDRVLQKVAGIMKRQLRKTDIVARLGGDEFALLLPETGHEAAQTAVSKLRFSLLDEMQKQQWPVTFSIGLLTCMDASLSVGDLIKMADELMYSVKKGTKNNIGYAIHGQSGQSSPNAVLPKP